MSENNQNIEIKIGSEKGFGFVFSVFFLVVALFPLLLNNEIRVWALLIAILFFLLANIIPKVFIIPNKLWFKLGLALGGLVAPIIIGFIYFFIVLPTSLIMKLIRKDLIGIKKQDKAKSYWISRNETASSMKNQY